MSSPIIFEKGTRDFSTLGLGLLSDAIQATTTEELNGQFIFEMDYPVSGNNADLIKENRIIVVNSGHILKRQGFIIRQIVRKIDLTMTVYAEHVSYATLDVALAPVGTISGDAKTALENWKRMLVPAVDFTVDSDILTTNSTLIGAPEFETARQGLGGHTGSILDVWGGEYQFDNWHIRLLKQRGKSANAIIAYGRNLISFEQDTNIADTYTSVYPYYQENSGDEGNKTHFLPERTVDSEFVGKYPNPKVLMLDLSNKFKDVADYSENKLRNYALSYIQSNNIGVPKVNMKISTVDLSRATGGFSEDIDLGDTVTVYFEKLGITTSAKVIKAVWNVLSDDYDKFEIGARRASLTESISELATTADENANKALNQALVALQSADGKSTIYYLNSSDPWPTNPNENDTAFVKDGENGIMYRYMFNNDTGVFSWVKILDSMSADQIKQRVSDALESGKAYSNQLVADNVAQVNAVLDDVQAKQADLSAQQAELDTKAQGYANQALADAKADTLATATQTAKDAQDALAKAKTDLTTSLNKEVTDRANAVTALDTKAKGYATQAKTDAIATANGAVAKEVTERQKAISALDTKSSNAIGQAKTDITQTINALTAGSRNYWSLSDMVVGSYIDVDGKIKLSGTGLTAYNPKYFSVLPNKTIIITLFDTDPTAPTVAAGRLAYYDQDKNFLSVGGNIPIAKGSYKYVVPDNVSYFRISLFKYDDIRTKVEIGTLATDWTPAPEDIAFDYTDKDNQIKQTFTQYQQSNDGKVSKAQTDATQALGLVATKVSQTDFDTKTGDLSTKYNSVKQTVDEQANEIADIQTKDGSQDSKINSITSDVNGTKQNISDIQKSQSEQSTKINQITTDVNGTKQSITDIQAKDGQQDTRMGTIETSVSGVKSDFSTYKIDANGRISTAQTTAQTAVDGLKTKVSQTDYNTKTGQIQTDLTTTTQTANQAKTDIVSIKQKDGDQDARMTQIESDASGIKTTVSDLKTAQGKQTGDISALKQRADGFDATVTKVNNLSVGGRNYWSFTNKIDGQLIYPDGSITNSESGLTAYNPNYFDIKQGQTVWVTIYNKISTNNATLAGRLVYYDKDKNFISSTSDIAITQGNYRNIAPSNSAYFRISLFKYTNIKIKVEIGTLYTDWTPAPEDVDNKISTVSQTVDSISSIVSDPTTGLTKRVQTAEGSISTVQSNVSDLQSKQTQTANGLTTEISNRATGDTNTLTQAKDFTTSSITSSETGMKSLITQTSDSIIAKVDTKTDSATVLSLLKDNWSIGISDNAGALASGIAGDLNGMTLISKKITLDGNTTVTGDFYAKGGNFKNINASNITVGNLDADEVRIINLDVNTLTGNVSRFLETNWDGAYGSTKITSTGMKINTQYIQADFQGFGMDFSYSNKKIGGMGISQYLNGQPGLSMRLESGGAYMAWSARNEGDSTGSYIDKLAWYRQGKPALGGNYGFIFSDRVTFNKPINVEGASINLGFRPINIYGNLFPFFGNQDNITGFAYTSNEIYMVLQNQYVNLSNVIKALSGLGAWSVPTNIDSTGKVTQWRNVTT